jgi:hypothetical protein
MPRVRGPLRGPDKKPQLLGRQGKAGGASNGWRCCPPPCWSLGFTRSWWHGPAGVAKGARRWVLLIRLQVPQDMASDFQTSWRLGEI